jgi:hypothetical protein
VRGPAVSTKIATDLIEHSLLEGSKFHLHADTTSTSPAITPHRGSEPLTETQSCPLSLALKIPHKLRARSRCDQRVG